MSTLKLNNIEAATGTTINIASGDKISGAAGSIVAPGQVIQTVSTTVGTEAAFTSSSFFASTTTTGN